MSYKAYGDVKPGLLDAATAAAVTSASPAAALPAGAVADPSACPAGTYFEPLTRSVSGDGPGNCVPIPGYKADPLAPLKTYWNASATNKAIVVAAAAAAVVGIAMMFTKPSLAPATPNRRRFRKNYYPAVYAAMERRIPLASTTELRRMASWLSKAGNTKDASERALLSRVRMELGYRAPRRAPVSISATPNRRYARNGSPAYRVIGPTGARNLRTFSARHQAAMFGDKIFGKGNYAVEYVFDTDKMKPNFERSPRSARMQALGRWEDLPAREQHREIDRLFERGQMTAAERRSELKRLAPSRTPFLSNRSRRRR